jgi:hypothetical protein
MAVTAPRALVLVLVGIAAALVWAGPATAAPADPLPAFSPDGTVPGTWTELDAVKPATVADPSCPGYGHAWKRTDGVRLGLFWSTCGADEIRVQLRLLGLVAARNGDLQAHSALHGADVLTSVQNPLAVARVWVQGTTVVNVTAICGPMDVDGCADLTAPAAQKLASRLPGTPSVPSALPPAGLVVAGFLLYWLLFVGLPVLVGLLNRRAYPGDPADPRIVDVTPIAAAMRRRFRYRRWGVVLLVAGAATLALETWYVASTGSIAGIVCGVICGLLVPAAGIVLLVTAPPVRVSLRSAFRTPLGSLGTRHVFSVALTGALVLMALALPVAALLGLFVVGLVSGDQNATNLLAGCVILALGAGALIDRGAQRLRARNAYDVINAQIAGGRRPYLYLRFFGDDKLKVPVSPLTRRGLYQRATGYYIPTRSARFEELLVRSVDAHGPVMAIDPPARSMRRLMSAVPARVPDAIARPIVSVVQTFLALLHVPQLGAPKSQVPTDSWKDVVKRWADQSHAVLLGATPGELRPGLQFEVELCAQRLESGRVVLILGPHEPEGVAYHFGQFVRWAGQYEMFAPLAEHPVAAGTMVLVHVPNHGWGTWYGWRATYRDSWSYLAAIDAALTFADEAWREPSRTVDPFRGLPLTSTVDAALRLAASRTADSRPISTRDLLVALADVDTMTRWDRVWLAAGGQERVSTAAVTDPAPSATATSTCLVTRSCAHALASAARSTRRQELGSVPAGVLALALVQSPDTAAARALGMDTDDRHREMRLLLEEELLGTRTPAPEPPAPSSTPASAGTLAQAMARGQEPLSFAFKFWTVVLFALAGFGFHNVYHDNGASDVYAATAVGAIAVGFVTFMLTVSAGSGRKAWRVALVCAAVVAAIGVAVATVVH